MPAKKTTPSRVSVFLNASLRSHRQRDGRGEGRRAGIDKTMHYRRLETDAEYRKVLEAMQDRVGQELEDALIDCMPLTALGASFTGAGSQ